MKTPLVRTYRSPDFCISQQNPSVFLGGGISNCPDWQSQMVELLTSRAMCSFDIINPRRVGDLAKDGNEAAKQVEWEHRRMEEVSLTMFWFPKETLCPITLFELGYCLGVERDIIVGADPGYQRLFDIQKQISLKYVLDRPIVIHSNLSDLANDAISALYSINRGER